MLDFLREQLWRPMVERGGYTPATTVFMALLLVLAVETYWKIVRKTDQRELRRAAVPWIVLAGLVRFADSRALPGSLLTITPGIFAVMIVAFSLSALALGMTKTRKLGLLLAGVFVIVDMPFLGFSRALFLVPIGLVFLGVSRIYSSLGFMSDRFAWMPHIFEAWVTSFGVHAGLVEEHVLASALMQASPFLFGIVKTLLIPLIMYLIRDLESKQKTYIGTVIGAIGLGPGVRDLLELLSL